MKGRLFTFGCSFTRYRWPTWADILGKEFDVHHNHGGQGMGNLKILITFLDQSIYHNINKDDTVIIMWTNVTREDRYIDGKWVCPGNIFTQNVYDENFVKKYVDIEGCYQRDIPLMNAAHRLLENLNCNYHMLSMVDINNYDQYTRQKMEPPVLFSLYHKTLSSIKPSVHDVVFNYDYETRPIPGYAKRPDLHPLPMEHLAYLQKVLPEYNLSKSTIDYVWQEQDKAYKILHRINKPNFNI